ncbi:MAG: hypothetical protein IT336_04170 [Thermomicrobiales bacterium]|nr:hypothetical protein [Thermomicrobiales bacterium]
MKLSFLDRKQDRRTAPGCSIESDGATLRVVQQPAHVRSWEPVLIRGGEWSAENEPALTGGVDVRAEITTKRFVGNQVSQDRYEATLQAYDGSPSSLIAALSAACAGIDDFRAVNGSDERVILQISLIR